METPVLFLIFNRPDTTEKVFSAIRAARPPRLYIAADGPRKEKIEDQDLCAETRRVVAKVDWDCQVFTLFRDQNLGCRTAVSSAISWFFAQEEMGIILEDDCLPDPTFFPFCEIMLKRYAHDTRITHIGGSNYQENIPRGDGDYYFSRLVHVWGWASWRRAWDHYDVDMKRWELFKRNGYLRQFFPDVRIRDHYMFVLEETYMKRFNTWDYQLFFSSLVQGGLSVIPNVNLISNIGYGPQATHTHSVKVNPHANLPVTPMHSFREPSFFLPDTIADKHTVAAYVPGAYFLRKAAKIILKPLLKAMKK